jgi:pimeloyl-ACP methyl ester carboxylesterase
MTTDPAPAVYIGRPCYFGLATSANCEPAQWTSERYSAAAVASMREVIEGYLQRLAPSEVVLIGYSGGGALAALLAAELGPRVALVTVAGNLDTTLWTTLRGFLPLTGSLNPKDRAERLGANPQVHLVGGQDAIVPLAVTRSFTGQLGLEPEPLREYPAFDHRCCWLQIWPDVLAEAPWR